MICQCSRELRNCHPAVHFGLRQCPRQWKSCPHHRKLDSLCSKILLRSEYSGSIYITNARLVNKSFLVLMQHTLEVVGGCRRHLQNWSLWCDQSGQWCIASNHLEVLIDIMSLIVKCRQVIPGWVVAFHLCHLDIPFSVTNPSQCELNSGGVTWHCTHIQVN